MTSMGISIWTGRGRALPKIAKARVNTAGSSSGRINVWLNAVTLEVRLRCEGSSCSRPPPMPNWSTRLTLEITSIGTESP